MSLLKKSSTIPVLYHGTCTENAKNILANGWQPNVASQGGNMGQTKYLYLSTGYDDALWFAEEKGCDTVLELRNVPLDSLIVDPEDGIGATVEEEINNEIGLPGKVALTKPLDASHFKLASHSKLGSTEAIHCVLDIMDARRGELFGKVEAFIDDKLVGWVQFSEAGNPYAEGLEEGDEVPHEVWIKYVYVEPEYRRRGVGTAMYRKISQEFPGEKIVSSGTTDEGGAFRSKLTERGVIAAAERLKPVVENGIRKYVCPCGNVDLDDKGKALGPFVECDENGNETPEDIVTNFIRCGKCGRVFNIMDKMKVVRQGVQHSMFGSLAPSETWERIKRDFYAGIVYHGTTVGIAEEIMKNGFRGLNYDQILKDVLELYGKKWEDISPMYQKIIRENKSSYSHEFDTVSTSPAGEVALRFAGQGGEVPHQIERFVLESTTDLKPEQSRISGEPAVIMCRIKDFQNTPFYQRVDQWMKGLEMLAQDGGITGDFNLNEAAEDAWTHYTNFNCTPDQLEPIRVLRGGALTLLKNGPPPEGKLAGKLAKMAKEDIKPSKNASTQINLPKELAWKIQRLAKKIIDPADLMGDGFEDESHITLKYGVEENEDGLIEAVHDLAPFEIKFGKTHVFEPSKSSEGAAPVVINIDAPELYKLRKTIDATIGNRKDDFEYHPHATLAYVKPEAAAKYDGLDFLEGIVFECENITLSKKDRIQITVPFGKIKKTASSGTSSMTMNATVDGFPAVVVIRWPQRGMRWRSVLKVVKQIAGEVAGKRVPWREIHIFESPWGSFDEQQEVFPHWAQDQKYVMYDIVPDGTFISVGKPHTPPDQPRTSLTFKAHIKKRHSAKPSSPTPRSEWK